MTAPSSTSPASGAIPSASVEALASVVPIHGAPTTRAKPRALVEDIKPVPTKDRSSLGVVDLVLGPGQHLKAVGVVYGVEHGIDGEGYRARLFLDQYNQRIRILSYEATSFEALVLAVRYLAEANGFDKIIAFATRDDWQEFLRFGYVLEAVIAHYHRGEDAYVVSKFRSQERLSSPVLMDEILLIERILAERTDDAAPEPLPEGVELRMARRDDLAQLVELYGEIFETYPSPLLHASYLEAILQKDSLFAVCTVQGRIVAAASAELHPEDLAAELTDCATRPEARGRGLMTHLLRRLERELVARGYLCAYTMARARSYGMNAVFHGLGYRFMGRLVNSCDIYGAYEDMNIWVRRLEQPAPPPGITRRGAHRELDDDGAT
jgi:putative beta-lysine N-acetyltransferase